MPLPINRPGDPGRSQKPAPQNDESNLPGLDDDDFPRPASPPRRGTSRNFDEDLMSVREGRNVYDDGDDPFESLPIDEVTYDEEDTGPMRTRQTPPAPRPPRPEPPLAPPSGAYDPDEEDNEKERLKRNSNKRKKIQKRGYTDDTFIDEKTQKLKPFGSGRRKAKVGEFDKRKNLRARSKIVQWVFIVLMIILVLLGLKNALVPPATLEEDEVAAIYTQLSGETDFPVERGKGFATDFMAAYLTIDPQDQVAIRSLGYFYSGNMNSQPPASSRVVTSDFRQRVVHGPTVYDSKGLTDYSARYTIGALVEAETTESSAPQDGSSARWAFFNVNVYWDAEIDSFTITPNSPTVVAPLEVGLSSDLPRIADPGSDSSDNRLTEDVRSVVLGYIRGYAISSLENHVELEQYVIPDPPPELVAGLDKRYTLDEDSSRSVTMLAYPGATENDLRVEAEVRWIDSVDPLNKAEYTSTYLMSLEKQANGQYLVSRFVPRYYVKETE